MHDLDVKLVKEHITNEGQNKIEHKNDKPLNLNTLNTHTPSVLQNNATNEVTNKSTEPEKPTKSEFTQNLENTDSNTVNSNFQDIGDCKSQDHRFKSRIIPTIIYSIGTVSSLMVILSQMTHIPLINPLFQYPLNVLKVENIISSNNINLIFSLSSICMTFFGLNQRYMKKK